MNRSLNDVVMVDHFYLDQLRVFHAMDSYSRFSADYVVPDASLESAVVAFESVWIGQFWPPDAVQGDQAFTGETFQQYLKSHGISFRPVPSRRHHKNTLEPKHGIIRSIYLRLQSASPTSNSAILALRAVSISNDLYGSDTLSAFELAKGFTKPVAADSELTPVPADLIYARDQLIAKRKLTLILRSHITADPVVNPGDIVQVYVRTGKEKRGRWLSPRTALSIDRSAGTVTVAGSNGKRIVAAVEDTRVVVVDNDLAHAVIESLDTLNDNLSELTEDLAKVQDAEQHDFESLPSPDAEHTSDDPHTSPAVGDRPEVFWRIDNQFYPGVVQSVEHNKHVISYDDGDKEELVLSDETWRALPALNSSIIPGKKLKSNEQTVLAQMLDTFGNKSFLRQQAQGFEQAVIVRS